MNLAEFLQNLSQQNVELFIEAERLRYRGPKEILTPTLLNQIKQHKQEILQLLQEKSHTAKSYPLTYGQQGLWFMYQFAPESGAYNIAFTVRICSSLNILALERACQKLILRHPTLRTTFGQNNAEPFQTIHAEQKVGLTEIDATTWNWEKLTEQVIEVYQRPFDLERGPILRLCLFTRSAQEYIFLLAIHHIAVDGFSFGILLDELRLLYHSENTGQKVYLSTSQYQYPDFVQWQRQMLQSPKGEHLWSYWSQQLAGELSVLKLPTDRPRGQFQKHQGASYTFELPKALTAQLKQQAKALGVTLYMTLLTVFAILLHRYTAQEDIIISSPTEGRSQPEFAGIVGFFVNILAIRVNLANNPTISELLTQVRQTVLQAIAHQDYPSPLLVEQFQQKSNLSLTKILRVSFNLMKLQELGQDIELSVAKQAKARTDWGGLHLEPFVIPQQEGQNDLVFDMMETSESLLGLLRYNSDLFEATTIRRMAGHFQNLLAAIVTNCEQQIGSLPLLTTTEQQQLLLWQNTQANYPQNQCIHQLFEDQVALTPDAIAVKYQHQQITYQELNARANQLAHHLQSLGVKQEVLVGICVERSLEMVVGLLGILKAGGAYLPLDPSYPPERLQFMLSDAQISVLLTQQKLITQLPTNSAQVVYLDTDWGESLEPENLVTTVQPKNLAYVIYTSGSTGKPKGVMIEHQSLVNFTHTAKLAYELRPSDYVLQFASISFDTAAEEIYPCLSSGGTLVLRTEEMLSSGRDFVQACQDWQITVLDLPTAYWHQLTSELAIANLTLPKSLRLVIIGGEPVLPQQVAIWQQHVGSQPKLVNTYGPTEATVVTTLCELSDLASSKLQGNNIPIGKPIFNTQVYILDRYLQPTPIGVVGELYIGGAGLARGYLNHPDLTKQQFIPHPFDMNQGTDVTELSSQEKSKLLYKTGDLARYLADGNIEFLGRIDHQVKIRGFRIELTEIETVLHQHPSVRTAVVTVREDIPGEKTLVAYVVHQLPTAVNELRGFLIQKLPGYMIPSFFVVLESLPLTPNGKVDFAALPAPCRTQLNLETTFELPHHPVEEILVTIWAKVLKIEQISIQDNFFELGGHSLLAAQLISKINQKFSRSIPLSILFQHPTIAGLANFLIQNPATVVQPTCLVPIQPQGNLPPLFCLHSAGGQVIAYQDLAVCLRPNQPVYGLQSRALNDPALEHQSIDCMSWEYAHAIRQHQPHGPYFLLGWSMGGALAVSVAQKLEQLGESVSFIGLVDAFLVPDDSLTYENLLVELALRFSQSFAEAVMAIHPSEKQALQEKLTNLPYFESLRQMLLWGQQQNLLSTEISYDILETQVALNKIHEQLFRGYCPPQVQANLYIWWAANKLETRLSQTNWSQYTTGKTYTEIVDGNHFNIIYPPQVNLLAQQLQKYLAMARSLQISCCTNTNDI